MSAQQEFFSYKGYFGSAEVSHEDHCVVGQLLYIDDLVIYEGDTYDEIERAFQQSVDDYLQLCSEVGKEPQKTYSGSFNVRIGATLHLKAARAALRAEVSLNDYVRQAIAQSVEERGSVAFDVDSYVFLSTSGLAAASQALIASTALVNVPSQNISSPHAPSKRLPLRMVQTPVGKAA
jgi:predicted HicB family RNase H-like nuclease